YLRDALRESPRAVSVTPSLATDLRAVHKGLLVETAAGARPADAVVLALGYSPPVSLPVSLDTRAARRRVVDDPWAPGALARLGAVTRPGETVLLVGTGLTAVDVALSIATSRRRVVAVSRNGQLPRAHR